MNDRRRNTLVLLIVVGLLALSGVVIATQPTFLGLDLKGGVELVYQGKATAQSQVNTTSLQRAISIMQKRVNQLGVAEPQIEQYGSSDIEVSLPNVTNEQRAKDQVGKTAQLYFYDWEPNVIGANGQPAGPNDPTATGDGSDPGGSGTGITEYQAVQRAAARPAVIYPNATTYTKGCTPATNASTGCLYGAWYLVNDTTQQVLDGPADQESELQTVTAALAALGPKHAKDKTSVVHVNPGTVVVEATPTTNSAGDVTVANPASYYVLNDNPVLTGNDITNPAQSTDPNSGQPDVTFGFDGHGTTVFEAITKTIAQRGQSAQVPGVPKTEAEQHFAIVLDNQLISVPSIDYTQYPTGIDATNGSEISGGFTLDSAQNLANELQSGALPIRLSLISLSQVSATLGKQALNQGLIAGLIGFLAVCLFLLVFYRVLGLIAIGGLIVYGAYFFALIKLIPITLTLAGIAGLILTIGVAADANIVIFERVKEEIRGGRSIAAGIATGYKRGFAAIVDANVVTIMVAFILFVLSSADVKGFALTLGIGTIVSLFTAVLATQAALGAMSRSRFISSPAMVGAGKRRRPWTFDFMGNSRWFFSLSGTILLVGALAIGGRGINFGIDFKGGTEIQAALIKPATQAQVASAISAAGYSNASVQKYSHLGNNAYQVATQKLTPDKVTKVQDALNARFGIKPGTFNNVSIGASFGRTIADAAIVAIIASLVVISLYIALRFEWKYAVPVLIALMHDLLITSGVYALTGRQVTADTVAALLTILGYSLYDTIIVFDRVRENVPRMPRAAFSQIVNRSMSEVLTRSLATSLCTLLPIVALLVFGGTTLKDFAFALMVGVASGAYSSIFIASPVLTHWKEREPVYRNRRQRLIRDLGAVPAYAEGAAAETVEPEPRRRRSRRGSIIAPETPGEQISKAEFADLVRDLDVGSASPPAADEPSPGARARARRTASAAATESATAPPASEPDAAPAPELDPAADALPEDVVMKSTTPRPSGKSRRNRRHGRR